MQEVHDDDVVDEVYEDFETLYLVDVGYGRTKDVESIATQSSSIVAFMYGVQKKCCVGFTEVNNSPLYNHYIGYDECRKIYMKAEVRHDSLDKGAELTEESLIFVNYNAMTGDIPYQFIDKKLGGQNNGLNAFPLSPNADISSWQTAITSVYDHVKQGEENTALIMYVILYAYENDTPGRERPSQVFYIFKLYTKGEMVGERIVGKFKNPASNWNSKNLYYNNLN